VLFPLVELPIMLPDPLVSVEEDLSEPEPLSVPVPDVPPVLLDPFEPPEPVEAVSQFGVMPVPLLEPLIMLPDPLDPLVSLEFVVEPLLSPLAPAPDDEVLMPLESELDVFELDAVEAASDSAKSRCSSSAGNDCRAKSPTSLFSRP
jgi:hypothetical protein